MAGTEKRCCSLKPKSRECERRTRGRVQGPRQGLGCHAQSAKGWKTASFRQADQVHHRDGSGQGRASHPDHQAPVRLHEGLLPGPRQEPRPALHVVRAWKPVSGANKVYGIRARLPRIRQTAKMAAQQPVSRLSKRSNHNFRSAGPVV